jgi:hypothetical protein
VGLQGKRADDHHPRAASRGPIGIDTHPHWWLSEPPDTRRRDRAGEGDAHDPAGRAARRRARPSSTACAPSAPSGPPEAGPTRLVISGGRHRRPALTGVEARVRGSGSREAPMRARGSGHAVSVTRRGAPASLEARVQKVAIPPPTRGVQVRLWLIGLFPAEPNRVFRCRRGTGRDVRGPWPGFQGRRSSKDASPGDWSLL